MSWSQGYSLRQPVILDVHRGGNSSRLTEFSRAETQLRPYGPVLVEQAFQPVQDRQECLSHLFITG